MSRGQGVLVLGGEPRADLMPAEVRVKRRGRGIRRLLALILVLSVAAVAAGVMWATVRAATATAELQAAQARTADLLTQQTRYSEVTLVASHKAKLEQDRLRVTATEVLWKQQLDPVLAVLPETATVVAVQARFPGLGETQFPPAGPLRQERAAEIVMQVLTPTVPEVTTWLRTLAGTPAFADEIPAVVTLEDGGYLTTMTLNLSADALAERFGSVPEQEPETEEEQ